MKKTKSFIGKCRKLRSMVGFKLQFNKPAKAAIMGSTKSDVSRLVSRGRLQVETSISTAN